MRLKKFGFDPAPLVLGLVIAPIFEMSLRQSLIMSNGTLGDLPAAPDRAGAARPVRRAAGARRDVARCAAARTGAASSPRRKPATESEFRVRAAPKADAKVRVLASVAMGQSRTSRPARSPLG